MPFCQLDEEEMCIFYIFQIITYEIILKQLFTSGSLIIVNQNLDRSSRFLFTDINLGVLRVYSCILSRIASFAY